MQVKQNGMYAEEARAEISKSAKVITETLQQARKLDQMGNADRSAGETIRQIIYTQT